MKGLLLIAGLCEAIAATMIGGFWLIGDTLSIEVGPALAALLGTLIMSSFAAFTAWLAYKRADESNEQSKKNSVVIQEANIKTTADLSQIHTAVNSTATKMSEDLDATRKQLLEVSKLLAASQAEKMKPAVAPVPSDSPTEVVITNPEPVPVKMVGPTKDVTR